MRDRQGGRARARFNLVAPLATGFHAATDTRSTDTSGQLDLFAGPAAPGWSGAVAPPIGPAGMGLRQGDVITAIDSSAPTFPATAGSRASTTATRTGITPAIGIACSPSADRTTADFLFRDLLAAYMDFRQGKRGTRSVQAFEADLSANLVELHGTLLDGTYTPGRSICFAITRPKPREVWAAQPRDRVVHHLLYRHVAPRFERAFIADSAACIEGRGTLYAARRLEAKVRAATGNWRHRAYFLKCDFANFFVSIDKPLLMGLLARRIRERWWLDLARRILMHDPRGDVEIQGGRGSLAVVPAHKSLLNQTADKGLPIGNLSSQFFANVYLNELDQFVKHRLRARHYVRYVDDFVLLHESPAQLNAWRLEIEAFAAERLRIAINPRKTILQPLARGVDFTGQVIKPWRRTIRRRTVRAALHRVATMPAADVASAATSYMGLLRQATANHRDRALLANAARRRGFAVDHRLTKVYA